jgi:hypothetical protein
MEVRPRRVYEIPTMDARKLRLATFAALTVLGAVGTFIFNLKFSLAGGFNSPTGFVDAATVNFASTSVAIDVAVAATAGIVFMVSEGRRLGVRYIWVYVVLSALVAFAATLPAFLFARELRMAARERAGVRD